ncbi:hypothetical protein OG389_18145 [Streptomyces sp. NBC_00435]|uniref:hypothetical protein n=1 Tax=Streptomyces sp. NBC_00435 TaxID=2903649 RepID=UPI002E1CF5F9
MTEPQNDVTPVPAEVSAEAQPAPGAAAAPGATYPDPYPVVPVRPVRTFNRKAFALVVGVVAVAALVGGGVWASSAIADADRDAPTAYWVPVGDRVEQPAEAGPVPPNALSGKLLPVPTGFKLGPDMGSDGNNFFVSGEKAIEGFNESRSGLSTSQRKKREETLAELKLKGLAGRTYVKGAGAWVAEVRIMQADPKAVGNLSEVTKKLLELAGDKREAPKVDGFPDAKCALLAIGEENKEKIDSIDCTAVQGDVAVTFRAYGPKPFSTSDAVAFFKNQMSHLKSPGESV